MAMQGRKKLLQRLQKIQKAPRRAARAALEKGAADIATSARNLAPKKSGALAASIGHTFGNWKPANANVRGFGATRGGDPDLTVTVHAGSTAAFYVSWVEFGTSPHDNGGKFKGTKHPGAVAQPFFFPAWRMHKRRVKSSISRAMSKAIRDSR